MSDRWYVTVIKSGVNRFDFESTIIEEHPVAWSKRTGMCLFFAMRVPEDLDDDRAIKYDREDNGAEIDLRRDEPE